MLRWECLTATWLINFTWVAELVHSLTRQKLQFWFSGHVRLFLSFIPAILKAKMPCHSLTYRSFSPQKMSIKIWMVSPLQHCMGVWSFISTIKEFWAFTKKNNFKSCSTHYSCLWSKDGAQKLVQNSTVFRLLNKFCN